MALSEEQLNNFEDKGFVVVPGVLQQDQISGLRTFFEGVFSQPSDYPGDSKELRNDICSRYPETRFLLTHPPLISALKGLLGDDFVLLPEMAVHDHRFGPWHKDTTSMEQEGLETHWKDDFRIVQVALYLQPNTEEWGGGLDIVPGSHKERDAYVQGKGISGKLERRRRFKRAYSIPNQAGDMVAFNLRADHQATQPKGGDVSAIPADHRKFAIFFVCSANNEHARNYKEFITGRSGYDYLEGHSYPDEVRDAAEKQGLTLA
jgi:hypothetical protein